MPSVISDMLAAAIAEPFAIVVNGLTTSPKIATIKSTLVSQAATFMVSRPITLCKISQASARDANVGRRWNAQFICAANAHAGRTFLQPS